MIEWTSAVVSIWPSYMKMTWMIENLHWLAKSKLDDIPQGQNVYKVVFETKKSAGFLFFFFLGLVAPDVLYSPINEKC